MARKSSIDRMSQEVRDWIARLNNQGRTLDEIIAKLRELDMEAIPSRSALGRHLQRADKIADKMRKSRQVSEVIVERLGEGDAADRATRMNIELMHNVVFDLLAAVGEDGEGGEPVTLDAQQVMYVAKALDHLGKASRDDVARTIAIEKRSAEKAKAEAMKAASKAVQQAGDGPIDGVALLKKIREEVYGIVERPA